MPILISISLVIHILPFKKWFPNAKIWQIKDLESLTTDKMQTLEKLMKIRKKYLAW